MTTDPAAATPTTLAPVHDLVRRLLADVSAVPDPVDREAFALELERELSEGARAAAALARVTAHGRQRPRAYVEEEEATFARPPWA